MSLEPKDIRSDDKALRLSFATVLGRMAGAMAAVMLASAPLTFLLSGLGPLVLGKVASGLLLFGIYAATHRDFFARLKSIKNGGVMAISFSTLVVVLALVVVANIFVARFSTQFDLTHEKIYTLSAQTQQTVAQLETPIRVLAFYASQEQGFHEAKEVLGRYEKLGPNFSFRMVNPQNHPGLIKKYDITERGPRLVITAQNKDARAKTLSEEDLTNAIVKVVEKSKKTVYFLVGHGEGDSKNSDEPEAFGALANAMMTDGYNVETLSLLEGTNTAPTHHADTQQEPAHKALNGSAKKPAPAAKNKKTNDKKSGPTHAAQEPSSTQQTALGAIEPTGTDALEVPDAVGILVVTAPKHPVLAPESAAIGRFLRRGGRLWVLEEAQADSGLKHVLADWHIEAQNDLVVDTNPIGRLMGLGVASPIIQPTEQGHPIVRGLSSIVMSTARSLTISDAGGLSDVVAESLCTTGTSAWGETQLNTGGTIAHDASDHDGPLIVGVAAHTQKSTAQAPPAVADSGRLVVFGDSDWASNRFLNLQSNEDLALNTLGWLADDEGKVTIRPRSRTSARLTMSGDDMERLKFFSMDLLPVLMVAAGLGIVLMRRQR